MVYKKADLSGQMDQNGSEILLEQLLLTPVPYLAWIQAGRVIVFVALRYMDLQGLKSEKAFWCQII